MKIIIYGKTKIRKYRGFEVDDDAVLSLITPKKDKYYADFLNRLQLPMPYLQDSRVSREIFKALGIAGDEPASDNTKDMDYVIMSHNLENAFAVSQENELVSRYITNFFKRHTDAFVSRFGYPLIIISEHDDIEELPELYESHFIEGKYFYSAVEKATTTILYKALTQTTGEPK